MLIYGIVLNLFFSKKVIKYFKTLSKQPLKFKRIPCSLSPTSESKVSLKLSEKNGSYHITQILSIVCSHLWIIIPSSMSSFRILSCNLRQSEGHFWGKTISKSRCSIIKVENNVKYIKCNPSEEKNWKTKIWYLQCDHSSYLE